MLLAEEGARWAVLLAEAGRGLLAEQGARWARTPGAQARPQC